MTRLPDIDAFFHALWNHDPFPWQRLLTARLAEGEWPETLRSPYKAVKASDKGRLMSRLVAWPGPALGGRVALKV